MSDKKEKREVSLETMAGVGKEVEIAGRNYTILPINIEDMHYLFGDNAEERLLLFLDEEGKEKNTHIMYGSNLVGKKKDIFINMITKYVYYCKEPMTEKLLVEHNWSLKEIKTFMDAWIQISD